MNYQELAMNWTINSFLSNSCSIRGHSCSYPFDMNCQELAMNWTINSFLSNSCSIHGHSCSFIFDMNCQELSMNWVINYIVSFRVFNQTSFFFSCSRFISLSSNMHSFVSSTYAYRSPCRLLAPKFISSPMERLVNRM